VSQKGHAKLGNAVSNLSREQIKLNRGGHVDNTAITLLKHMRKHCVRASEGSARVNAVDEVIALHRSLDNILPPQGTSVINQIIDSAKANQSTTPHWQKKNQAWERLHI
jgi:uncharacterized protein (DUF4213/DUF364 family)